MKTLLTAVLAVSALSACGAPNPCAPGSRGNIEVRFTGLPATATGAKVTLTGPSSQEVTAPMSLMGIPSGEYTVAATKAVVADPRVRTVYAPTHLSTVCPASATVGTVLEIAYAPIATSNKLWLQSQNNPAGSPIAFNSSDLVATGTPAATVKGVSGSGKDIFFDKDGNLWTFAGTTADAPIARYSAASMTGSARKRPDREFTIAAITCGPGQSVGAFDKSGNLWMSSPCSNKVYRFAAAALAASGALTASVTLSGFDSPQGLAFDAAGNLWVADIGNNRVYRFDAPQLAADTAAPVLTLALKTNDNPMDNSRFSPLRLAFDGAGNLWANDFGGNNFFTVPKAQLGASGNQTLTPPVRITIGVTALLEGFAFDESGGLWSTFSNGKIARLSPAQLTVSSGPGAPTQPETVITSSDLGSGLGLGFYPAPANSPLFGKPD